MSRRKADRAVSVAPREPAVFSAAWPRAGALAAVAILVLSLFTGEIRDTDIWLHLKTGERTWGTRALAVPDPFSYTSAMGTGKNTGEELIRYFNLTHEWLAQVIMYGVYSVAGFPALVLGRAALLMLFCGLAGWIVFLRTGDFFISVTAALVSAGVAFQFQQSRPFLVTFVCLALTFAILESRRRMWLLPAVFLVWANCHAGFFTGWLALAAYCAQAVIGRLRNRPVAEERQLWLVTGACLIASALNPNAYRVIQILFLYRSSGIQSDNLEWQRPIFWEPGIHSFVLFGSLAAMLFAARRVRTVDWLLYLGFGAISLMAVRNAIFMGLIGPVLMATYAPVRRRFAGAAALLAAALLVIYYVAPAMAAGNVFALRAADWQLPSGAADFIETRRIAARMFNGYETGGYLVWRLWPLQQDFIDPRGLSEEAYADYRRILMNIDESGARGAESLLRKYGIEMIVIDGFDYLSGQVHPLVVELSKSAQKAWKLAYADSKSLLFLRRAPLERASGDSAQAMLESLEKQCDEHLRHEPARPRCARGLAELYSNIGDVPRASRWISRYREIRAEPDPEAARIYWSLNVTSLNDQALALESKGDLAEAEVLFRSAVETAGKNLGLDHADTAGSLNNLADLLESKGDLATAEPLYRRALAIAEKTLGPGDLRTAMSLENLAGLLASKGELAEAEPLYRRALAISTRALGPDDPSTQTIRQEIDELRGQRRKKQRTAESR